VLSSVPLFFAIFRSHLPLMVDHTLR